MVILISSYHIKLEFHCTFLHQHSRCALPYLAWPQYFISDFQPFTLVLQATNTGGRSHGYEAKAEPHYELVDTAAVVGGTAAVVGGTQL